MEEIWKDIKGFEQRYQVSNRGQVRSLNYERHGKIQELRFGHGDGRYPQVVLSKDGKRYTRRVHRLVAEAFLPNPEGKRYIDHIDTNIENCDASNLRWATAKENANNPITAQRRAEGIKRYWNQRRLPPSNGIHFRA